MESSRLMLRVCCVCRRVQVGERWERPLLSAEPQALVTHTYCPQCFHEALERLHPAVAPTRPAALVLACG